MDKDTQEELERLEEALLSEPEELVEEELLTDLDLEGIFEELSDPADVDEDAIYSNCPNDYDEDLQDFADQTEKRVFGDKLTIGLMLAACALCLGIIGVMVYWLNNFL